MPENYIDKKVFYEMLVSWNKKREKDPDIRVSEEIGGYIILIAENMSKKFCFNRIYIS